MYECDDGNLVDGDGCNSECKLEKGFKCQAQEGKPDICKDVVKPYGTLSVYKENTLIITFNEMIRSKLSSILQHNYRH